MREISAYKDQGKDYWTAKILHSQLKYNFSTIFKSQTANQQIT